MGVNILGFSNVVLSVVNDVPVDSEVCVVTSSISRICCLSCRDFVNLENLLAQFSKMHIKVGSIE